MSMTVSVNLREGNFDPIGELEKTFRFIPPEGEDSYLNPEKLNFWFLNGPVFGNRILLAQAKPTGGQKITFEPTLPEKADTYCNKGIEAFNKEKPDEAMKLFKLAMEHAPNSPEIKTYIARAFIKQGKRDEARQILKEVLREFPDFVPALVQECWFLITVDGKLKEAEEKLNKIVQENPTYQRGIIMLGLCYSYQDRYDEAERELKKALELQDDPLTWAFLARILFTREPKTIEKILESYECYKKAAKGFGYDYLLTNGTMHMHCYYGMFLSTKEIRRDQDALKELNVCLDGPTEKLTPDLEYLALKDRLLILIKLRKLDEAIKDQERISGLYERAVKSGISQDKLREEFPNIATLYYLVGYYCGFFEHYDKALEFSKRSIEIEPDNSEAHFYYGLVLALVGNEKNAQNEFEEAVQLDPENGDAHCMLGNVMADLRRETTDGNEREKLTKKATAAFETALSINGEDTGCLSDYAHFLVETGEDKKARTLSEEAIRIDPENWDAMQILGFLSVKGGDWKGALDRFEAAIKIGGDEVYISWYAVGMVYQKTGRQKEAIEAFKDAIKCLREVLKLDPNDADPYQYMGLSLAAINKGEEAYKYFKKATKLAPDDYGKITAQVGALAKANCTALAYKRLELLFSAEKNGKDVNVLIGILLAIDLKKYKKAIPYLQRALKSPQANANMRAVFHLLMAFCYYNLKNYKEVLTEGKEAIKTGGEDTVSVAIYYLMGFTSFLMKDYKGTMENFDKISVFSLGINCNNYENWKWIPILYFASNYRAGNKGSYRSVIDHAMKVLKMRPDDAEIYGLIGSSYIELQEFKTGIEWLEKAVNLSPQNTYINLLLASSLRKSARYPEAIERFKLCLDLDFNDMNVGKAYVYALISYCYLLSGDKKQALTMAERSIVLDPNCTAGYVVKAEALDGIEKDTELEKLYNKALELSIDKDNSEFLFMFAQFLASRGRLWEAKDKLEVALKIRSNYDEARELLATIDLFTSTECPSSDVLKSNDPILQLRLAEIKKEMDIPTDTIKDILPDETIPNAVIESVGEETKQDFELSAKRSKKLEQIKALYKDGPNALPGSPINPSN